MTNLEKPYDCHVHSSNSDGEKTIGKIASEAYKAGLGGFMLTDHETIAGVKGYLGIKDSFPVPMIGGLEAATHMMIKGHRITFEIKAAFFNPNNRDLEDLLLFLRYHRIVRINEMVDLVNKECCDVSKGQKPIIFNELLSSDQWAKYFRCRYNFERFFESQKRSLIKKFNGEEIFLNYLPLASLFSVGRNHLAKKMVKHGFVTNTDQAFKSLLNPIYQGEDHNCFTDRYTKHVEYTTNIIRNAGGLCGPCHPGTIHKQYERIGITLDDIYSAFLPYFEEGVFTFIESEYEYCETNKLGITPKEKKMYNDYWKQKCKYHGWLECNGSDTHGKKNGVKIGRYHTPYETIVRLKEIASGQHKSKKEEKISLNNQN